jgi:hypothetical protein
VKVRRAVFDQKRLGLDHFSNAEIAEAVAHDLKENGNTKNYTYVHTHFGRQ